MSSPRSHSSFPAILLAALMGAGITAGALVGADVVGDGESTTVVQQAPIGADARAADPSSPSGGGKALTARDIYKRDAPGVVFIRAQTVQRTASPFDLLGSGGQAPPSGVSTGSGFVIDREGFIVTNAHVVSSSTDVRVSFSDKTTAKARIVGKDESTDLALLKVDPRRLKLRPLVLGDSKAVQVGDPTVAIGNPFGLDRTLTTGVVSALQRRISAPNGFGIDNVIQTDASINPGNSGGPLIDAAGRVIGINSQIATGGGTTGGSGGSVGIGFAVPIDTAKQVIPQLKAEGRVERAYLGISGVGIDQSLAPLDLKASTGVLVQAVTEGGPAERAGLRGGDPATSASVDGSAVALGGDVIRSIDGKAVDSMDDVVQIVDGHKPGERVSVQILRDGAGRTVTVTLGNRPAKAPASP